MYSDIKQAAICSWVARKNASMYTHVGFRTHMRLFVSLFVYIGSYLGSVNSMVSSAVVYQPPLYTSRCLTKKTIKGNMLRESL